MKGYALDMPHITYTSYLSKGKLPKPSRTVRGLRLRMYNSDDIKAMRRMLLVHGYKRKGAA